MTNRIQNRLPGAFAAVALAAFVASSPARAINAILNDNFLSGTDPWWLNLGVGAAATLANDAGWGRVTITSGGSSRSAVNLDQPLNRPLVNGVTYTIAFDARADVAKSIDVLLRSSSTVYGAAYNVSIDAASSRHTITYTHSQSDADAKLSFRIGGNLTTFYLDNVVVTRQGAASQLLTNSGGAWQFNTLSVGGKLWNAGAYDFSYAGYQYGEREAFINISAATQTISAATNEDITDKLNAALAALPSGGTVIIPAGSFRIGAGKQGKAVTVSVDNTVIKGAGAGLTTLKIDATYHPRPLTDTVSDRQEAAFASGVITFAKSNSGNWFYGTSASNAAKVSSAVPLGARSITVSDPSGTLTNASSVVIRQIMWQSFVGQYAYNTSYAPKPYRWTNYSDDGTNTPLFSDPSFSFCYFRRILSRSGNTLYLDAPIPHALNPSDAAITVTSKSASSFLSNCGLQDLTLTADPEEGVAEEDALGCSVTITGVLNGLFKNVRIDSFRSLGFGTVYPVNTTFLNCTASNAMNCGGGGAGYGFYVKGQNLLYKNCRAANLRHGYTTAASQTSNIVIKNCSSEDFRFNTDITTGGESVDDTHLQYAHGILWDNHYAKNAGLLMIPRRELSPKAYETCGWGIVWNYENEGFNYLDPYGKDIRHNLLGVTPTEFGLVVGAHAGQGPDGIRVKDGYTRANSSQSSYDWGIDITSQALLVGSRANRVLYENTGQPVAESLYDILFAQRARLLP